MGDPMYPNQLEGVAFNEQEWGSTTTVCLYLAGFTVKYSFYKMKMYAHGP